MFSSLTQTLLTQLMACPSVTPDASDCFVFLAEVLIPLGFEIEQCVVEDVTNFFAIRRGQRPHLCFIGHVDVVPPGQLDLWDYPPFAATWTDTHIIGRGIADMKGAIVAFVTAVSHVIDDGFSGTISFVLTSDEEGPGTHGLRTLAPQLKNHPAWIPCDLFLVGEPTGLTLGSELKIGRRGSLPGRITVFGQQGHVAYPHLAQNPIWPLLEWLISLKKEPLDHGSDFFEPSHFEVTSIDVGNPVVNMIPHQAKAQFALRYNTHHTQESLTRWLETSAKKMLSAYHLDLFPSGDGYLSDPRSPWVSLLATSIERITGRTPVYSTTGGITDGRYFKDFGAPIIELGLPEPTIHGINEQVSQHDFQSLIAIYTDFLSRFSISSCSNP